MDQHQELAEAAASGIREYLRTMRGAKEFGASAEVSVNPRNEVVIQHGYNGNVTFFKPLTV